jgi:hypothetical protein
MASTVHTIERYSLQVLSKRSGEAPRPQVIVRLYNDAGVMCGTAVFKDYGPHREAELPIGDASDDSATAFYDITFFQAFIDILRLETDLYWKIHWIQMGAKKQVADVSLDTKKEIIGEFFSRPDGP